MFTMHGLLVFIAVIALWVVLHRYHGIKGEVICRNCGSLSKPKTVSPRTLWIEIPLWLFAVIPGVLYSLWCYHNTFDVCHKCGSRDILPADSPMGRKFAGSIAVDVTPMSQQKRS